MQIGRSLKADCLNGKSNRMRFCTSQRRRTDAKTVGFLQIADGQAFRVWTIFYICDSMVLKILLVTVVGLLQ